MKQTGCLLVFVSAWTILLIPVVEQSPILTQDGFDLERFMGRWYEVATISTCRFYMQRKEGNPVIVALELKHVTSEQNFTMASSTLRNGTCKETSTVYSLTDFPGQFFHHVARFGADVDSYVVHTNYDDYAMMLLLGTEKPSGIKTTTVKLYSRTEEMDSTVLNQFKNLVSVFQVDR
ncbi:protein AMBP-like isoform 2-T2 [Menidia menidia]